MAAGLIFPSAAQAPPRPPQVAVPGSLFFTPDQIKALNEAITAYESRLSEEKTRDAPAEDFLEQLAESKPDKPIEQFFTYPQFYLESLIYHTHNDWAVQINGQRFTRQSAVGASFRIIMVDKERVVLVWKPENMRRVRETMEKYPGKLFPVHMQTGEVYITLRHNQTFSSFIMDVLEGKVKPVVVSNTSSAAQPPKKDAKPPVADPPTEETPSPSVEPEPAQEEAL